MRVLDNKGRVAFRDIKEGFFAARYSPAVFTDAIEGIVIERFEPGERKAFM